jgi:hypothetical protein
MTGVLTFLAHWWPIHVLLGFIALYPMITAVVWVVTALVYASRREGAGSDAFYDVPEADLPLVTVLVPAFREEAGIDRTLEALHHLDYPSYGTTSTTRRTRSWSSTTAPPTARPRSRADTSSATAGSACWSRRPTRARPSP